MMNNYLEELFLREDVLDTVNYLIVSEKIQNLDKDKYIVSTCQLNKDLTSCQIQCWLYINFADLRTAENFLKLIDFLEKDLGLIQESQFSWKRQENVFSSQWIKADESIQLFMNFKMLDRDYFNWP